MDDVQNAPIDNYDESVKLRKEMGLITPYELANALGVSEVTLQVWRQKGNGPRFTKLGKNIFYPMQEVKHWTETNVLDRVNTPVQTVVPPTRYKTGEVVGAGTSNWDSQAPIIEETTNASSAEEIDDALAKLIGPKEEETKHD